MAHTWLKPLGADYCGAASSLLRTVLSGNHNASIHSVAHSVTKMLGQQTPLQPSSRFLIVRHFAKRQRLVRQPVVAPRAVLADEFFDKNVASSGVMYADSVKGAMSAAGFTRIAHVQALSSEPLLKGSNTVITAETGSGKTLAYVAPILSMMQRQQQKQAESAATAAAAAGGAEPARRPEKYHALVLCPNGALCQQVAGVVTSLRGPDGKPLAQAAQVNSSNPPPAEAPDFIIATPAGLMTLLNGPGASYGRLWTPEGLQARVKHVVLDEADLLMGAAYEKPVTQILQMLRSGDRRRVEARVCAELDITEKDFDKLPRAMQVAAWKGGVPALLEARYKHPGPPLDPAAQYGPYWRRQYVFVAATMPAVTTSDVGTQIQKLYPDAEWVATDALHMSKPQVAHNWVEVTDANWQQQLVRVVRDSEGFAAGKAKVLVFAKDPSTADAIAKVLQEAQIRPLLYHKNVPGDKRVAALQTMQQGESGVMVCTDAAARGIDIPAVTHVVQADFAPDAVCFIHRIGRTGRAGKAGTVTSLYREHNVPLVEVLKGFIAEGRPLEAAFSRARSFSRKLKRLGGRFVPRGMTPEEYEAAKHGPQPAVSASTPST